MNHAQLHANFPHLSERSQRGSQIKSLGSGASAADPTHQSIRSIQGSINIPSIHTNICREKDQPGHFPLVA